MDMMLLQKMIVKQMLMPRKYTIFCLLILWASTSLIAQSTGAKHKLRTIIIDAGHGGKDPGAIGKYSKEKDITLAVALALGEKIKRNIKDVKVIYTREDDRFIELFERANIANRNKADLFISIHINSSKSREAKGAEAWVLGLHRSDENLEVAKRENEVLILEGDVQKNYGFDPNSPAGNIMMTMQQSAFLNQSILFAKKVEASFEERMNRVNRGVHQAGFVVLYKTVSPSCLIELGFISNREEEQYMNSEHGREEIANSIFLALKKFKYEYEGVPVEKRQENEKDDDDKTKSNNPPTKNQSAKETSSEGLKVKETSSKKQPEKTEDQEETAKANEAAENEAEQPVKKEKAVVTYEDLKWNASYVKVGEKPNNANETKAESKPVDQKNTEAGEEKNIPKTTEVNKPMNKPVQKNNTRIYRVQIMARPEAVSSNHAVFRLYNDVEELKEDKVYRYVCGKFENIDDAINRKIDLKKKGYADAFIAVYEGGKRIGIKF